MRAPSAAFFLISLIFLFANLSDARKDPEDYWKSIMKEEAMPEAIQELLQKDPSSSSSEEKNEPSTNMEHFIKDFDPKPNVILYHKHGGQHHQEAKPCHKGLKQLQAESHNKAKKE
ncbi:organ-specific protein P4 [Diospyros lotus]|uniref:organ-specific protein P4 n=1 Tax=Diospyros lotus TaxID=55363 RepID=UPI0022534572|nr:organ-specific protein P4 [Diospyros lotus]